MEELSSGFVTDEASEPQRSLNCAYGDSEHAPFKSSGERPSVANKMDELQLLNKANKDFIRSAALCATETWLIEHILGSVLHAASKSGQRTA